MDPSCANGSQSQGGVIMRTHAQQTKSASAPASQATHAARAPTARQKNLPLLLQLQRAHGNQFMQRTLRTMVQPKLAVNRPGDRYEQEADRVAEAAVRIPDAVVQRKCPCDSGQGAPCEHCAAEKLVQRKSATPASAARGGPPVSALVAAPASVERALAAPGRPLPEGVRKDMEARLGHDFRATRIHDDDQAHKSAREISARAYTSGRHIVFGPGQYQIGTTEGRQLLAHELVHVIQQSGSQTGDPAAGLSSISGSTTTVQRAPAPADSWGTFGDMALEGALAVTMIPGPLRSTAAASVRGFTAELGHQFSGNKDAIAGHLSELKHVDNLKSLFGGYYGGLLAGIVSPLTGLFDMLVFADRMRVMVNNMVADAANRFAALLDTGRELVESLSGIASKVKGELSKIAAHPIDLIVSLLSDQGPSKLEAAGNKTGHDAVIAMANAVSKRFAPAAPAHGEAKDSKEEAPLAQVGAKIEKFKESLFSTPWSKVGYDMGYALGFAAVNILMLVFSGGVGNALTKLGSFLGELGGVLGSAGKLVTVLGRGIMFVEEAINAVMNVAMKPLQPLLRALEPHLQKLVMFLRKLLGVAEKEGAEAVAAAAKTATKVAKPKPPPVHVRAPTASPHPSAPTPHPAAPHPAISPHAEARPVHTGSQPHAEVPNGKAPSSPAHNPPLEANEAKALEQSRHVEHPNAQMIDDELKAANKLESHPTAEPGYVEEKVLPNGHTWRKTADGNWCRFSAKPSLCIGSDFTAIPKDYNKVPEGFDEIRDKPNMDLRKVTGRRPSGALADALEARGKPRPAGHEAHHIVPEGMPDAERARDIINNAGVKVNDAENGVWLRGARPGLQSESFGSHLGIHTPDYVAGVTAILEEAQKTGTTREALEAIGEMLEAGKINEIIKEGVRARGEGLVTFEKAARSSKK
jgi:hypothetical protein